MDKKTYTQHALFSFQWSGWYCLYLVTAEHQPPVPAANIRVHQGQGEAEWADKPERLNCWNATGKLIAAAWSIHVYGLLQVSAGQVGVFEGL